MNRSNQIVMTSLWWIPDGESVDEFEYRYVTTHVALVRKLPRLRRHVVLKIHDVIRSEYLYGAHSPWWRGEDLWFDDLDDFYAAVSSPVWGEISNGYPKSVAGLQTDVFEVEDEYLSADAFGPGLVPPNLRPIIVRGTWHTPALKRPEDLDRHYFEVHVPGARRIPGAQRHVVVKTIEWPQGTPKRSWRGAQVWHESITQYEQAINSPERREGVDDGFISMIAGLQLDEFAVEEEYIAPIEE